MQAALTATKRGHKVTLWESSNALGGQLNIAANPPHKEEIGHAVKYYEKQLRNLAV